VASTRRTESGRRGQRLALQWNQGERTDAFSGVSQEIELARRESARLPGGVVDDERAG